MYKFAFWTILGVVLAVVIALNPIHLITVLAAVVASAFAILAQRML